MANRQIVEEHIIEDEINILLDYWRVIVKRKKIIGIIVGVVFAGSIIYSLILPKIYASTASIFPPQQESSMSGIASQLSEGIISITVEDKDPQRAATLANAFVEELDKINKGMVTTSGRRMRVFVEERLKEGKVELQTLLSYATPNNSGTEHCKST